MRIFSVIEPAQLGKSSRAESNVARGSARSKISGSAHLGRAEPGSSSLSLASKQH